MSSSVATRENPYTIGVPVDADGSFFGREEVFESIRAYLLETAPVSVIRGQRRIGKSSVLRRMEQHVRIPGHQFVLFDLQAGARSTLGELLSHLSAAIADKIDKAPPVPLPAALEASPSAFVTEFLGPALQAFPGTLVLLFDEFDALGFQSGPDSRVGDQFGSILLWTLGRVKNLRVIAVVGRNLDQLDRLPGMFHSAPQQPLGLLDATSAERLIRMPSRGQLDFEPGAVDAIQSLACGHPYFTQLLCFSVFQRAKSKDKWSVSAEDVEESVTDALVRGRGGLTWFRDGLPVNERVMFSASAEGNGDPGTAGKLLFQRGAVRTEGLGLAEDRLREWGYLTREGRVAVELVGRWIRQEYPLREEIRELEKADAVADDSYRKARELGMSGDSAGKKKALQECVQRNPNHGRALSDLGAVHFDAREYGEAVERYRRAWRLNPAVSGEFVEALTALARETAKSGDAQTYLAEALAVDPKSESVLALLKDPAMTSGTISRAWASIQKILGS